MEYTDFNNLQNSYPADDPNKVSGSYKNENGEIVYSGTYPANFLTFDIIPVNDVDLGKLNVNQNINFRFIVKFVSNNMDKNTQYWTSKGFYDDLVKSNHDGNPYFNRELVTTATVDFELLNNYHLNQKFIGSIGTREIDGSGELYAEVKITNTIDTINEMLLHINWMVNSDDKELRNVIDFGSWEILTTSRLGFDESFYVPSLVDSGSNTTSDNTVPTRTATDGYSGSRGDGLSNGERVPITISDITTDARIATGSVTPTTRSTTKSTITSSNFITRLLGR